MKYTVFFLLLTLATAVFGFGNILTSSAHIAQGVFFVFIFLFVVSFIKEVSNPSTKTRPVRHK